MVARYVVVVFLLLILGTNAATYQYVDSNYGTDNSTCIGTTATHPCRTIRFAMTYTLTGGTLILAPGTYSGEDNTHIVISNKRINIASSDGDNKAIIDCNGKDGMLLTRVNGVQISNIKFMNCYRVQGAAILLRQCNGVTIENCTFSHNTANFTGGAIHSEQSNNIGITQCTFQSNTAGERGGAVSQHSGTLVLYASQFSDNSASNDGGAVYVEKGNLMLRQAIFTDNVAQSRGGAIFSDSATLSFVNGTLDNNCVRDVYYDGYSAQEQCIYKCIYRTDKISRVTGCTDYYKPDESNSLFSYISFNKNTGILAAVLVPICLLFLIAIGIYVFCAKRIKAEIKQHSAKRKAFSAKYHLDLGFSKEDKSKIPKKRRCILCRYRERATPFPCGHVYSCDTCRSMITRCPKCSRSTHDGTKQPTPRLMTRIASTRTAIVQLKSENL